MKVYCVQPDLVWHDAAANRQRVQKLIRQASPEAGSLVVLPETFASGFTNHIAAGTDSPRNETASWCAALAARLDCTVIAGLITTAADGHGRNQAVVCGPDGELGRYTKIHRFKLGGEAEQFAPGDRPQVFEIETAEAGSVRVAPLVCYDLRFPETFREAALEGVDVFVVIANWPAKRAHHWQTLLRARAIENQAFVAGVNRTGSDPNVTYSGGTSVYDFDGHALLSMDELPGVAATRLDIAALREVRRELPFLADFIEGYREGDAGALVTGAELAANK